MVVSLIYVEWGAYHDNWYGYRAESRATLAATSKSEEVQIAVVWNQDPDLTYLTGVEVGIEEVNSRRIPLADGRKVQLKPIYKDANDRGETLTGDTDPYGDVLSNLLATNDNIVAMLAKTPTSVNDKTSVVCESYGVALLQATRNDASLTKGAYRYQINVCPRQQTVVRRVNSLLENIVPDRPRKPVRIGVLFDATLHYVELGLHGYLRDLEELSSITEACSKLKKSVEDHGIDPHLTLRQLDLDHYLQSGLTDNPGEIETLLRLGVPYKQITEDSTLQDALQLPELPDRVNSVAFVRGFVPNLNTLRIPEGQNQIISSGEATDSDVYVVLTPLAQAADLVRRLRRINPAPTVFFQLDSPAFIRESLAESANGAYIGSILDPNSSQPEFVDFRTRFAARARAAGRRVVEANDVALLGYQSVLLLEKGMQGSGTSVPLQLVSALKFPTKPIELMGSEIKFDASGSPLHRPAYLLKFTGSGFEVVEKRKEP